MFLIVFETINSKIILKNKVTKMKNKSFWPKDILKKFFDRITLAVVFISLIGVNGASA